jgi:uncharacterized protein
VAGASRSSAWRIILHFPLTRIVLGVVLVVGAELAIGAVLRLIFRKALGTERVPPWVLLPVMLAVVHGSYVLFVRLVEDRQASELSLGRAACGLGIGIGLGAGIGLVLIGALWLLGFLRVVGAGSAEAAASYFALALFTGFLEEVVARGILFRIVEESLGTWIALALSALVFGFLHLRNPHATVGSGLAIALSAGIVLGAAYSWSRLLWVPIGLHFAWNFIEGGIFGLPVSGRPTAGLLRSELHGPPWATGGSFGPEASVLVAVLGLLVGTLLLYQAHRKGMIVAPFWSRRVPTVQPGAA